MANGQYTRSRGWGRGVMLVWPREGDSVAIHRQDGHWCLSSTDPDWHIKPETYHTNGSEA